MKPTIHDAVAHLADHYGMPKSEVLALLRVPVLLRAPVHPHGMRDEFAGRAMQAIVSTVPHLEQVRPADVAFEAYYYADAMMAERIK